MSLKTFLQNQIENYKKVNNVEIQLGRKISDNIFRTKYDNNFIDIIKEFRSYKLSYSQGKIYKNLDIQLKTFNNKNNEIRRTKMLEREVECNSEFDMAMINNEITQINEFETNYNYDDELEYDEINIHLNDNILLVFMKVKDNYNIKFVITLDKDLPYTYLDEYVSKLEEVIEILKKNIKY